MGTSPLPADVETFTDVSDHDVLARAARCLDAHDVVLPTFAALARPRPADAPPPSLHPDDPHPANLWRVHWYNGTDRSTPVDVPDHVEIPTALSGTECRIVAALGNRFPMIRAHKVLAAYACLVPRVVTGRFDPERQRAVWPSTGNYARGGVAISRIMGCRGVAVLPEGMSRERFDWLDRWVADPADVIRTVGTESNVKEIYDACRRLAADPDNVIVNQFSEYANHAAHAAVTAPALEHLVEQVTRDRPGRLAAFVSASGSAGTLAAGDVLKEHHGSLVVAAEALECPTMLCNGYGEHNIQGIGDKHIPLIHNVMNTDLVVAVSDRTTDALGVLFQSDAGRAELTRRRVPDQVVAALVHLGLSSICNVVAAVKTAKLLGLGREDVIVTVATDGGELYGSERDRYLRRHHPDGFGPRDAAAVAARHLDGITTDHMDELGAVGRERVFNLGYYTWVEQQGTGLAHFDARRHQHFWRAVRSLVDTWDGLIDEFNQRSGARRR